MLAGAHPQPRLDRVLARGIDLMFYGIIGFLFGLRQVRGPNTTETGALSSTEVMIMSVIATVVVLAFEVGPLLLGGSPGKALFALRVESVDGQRPEVWRGVVRTLPLAVVLTMLLVSLRGSIEVWWLTLGLSTALGLAGLIAIVRDRPTPWDRLAGTRVVSVPARR